MVSVGHAIFGMCTFLAVLPIILLSVGIGTTHWIVSTFSVPAGNISVSFNAYIGFFQFCYEADHIEINSTCINLHTTISTPLGLLIFGVIMLGFAAIISAILAIKPILSALEGVKRNMSKYFQLALIILFFLASLAILAGYSISWYYLYYPIGKALGESSSSSSSNSTENGIPLLLMQNATAGYSHNLSVAGQFFTYLALTLTAYGFGMARHSVDE